MGAIGKTISGCPVASAVLSGGDQRIGVCKRVAPLTVTRRVASRRASYPTSIVNRRRIRLCGRRKRPSVEFVGSPSGR